MSTEAGYCNRGCQCWISHIRIWNPSASLYWKEVVYIITLIRWALHRWKMSYGNLLTFSRIQCVWYECFIYFVTYWESDAFGKQGSLFVPRNHIFTRLWFQNLCNIFSIHCVEYIPIYYFLHQNDGFHNIVFSLKALYFDVITWNLNGKSDDKYPPHF